MIYLSRIRQVQFYSKIPNLYHSWAGKPRSDEEIDGEGEEAQHGDKEVTAGKDGRVQRVPEVSSGKHGPNPVV